MFTFGQRLKEERERIGLSQADFGALAGVSKVSQINYEKDVRSPDAKYLCALHENEVDTCYLLSGVRAANGPSLANELSALSDAWEAIDLALAEAKKTLPSEKKRKAAEALYMAVKHGEGEAKPLARLLSKAA